MKSSIATILLFVLSFSLAESKPRARREQKPVKDPVVVELLPGELLLTEIPVPGEPEIFAVIPLEIDLPRPDEIVGDSAPTLVIPEKFLEAYFAERPQKFLTDPQQLLSPSDFKDRLDFLNYHVSDSSIDLFVYVMGKDQEIPGEAREEELVERFYAEGRPAVIVYYFLGAPQRSVIHVSPLIADQISVAEQQRTLESSIVLALEKVEPATQLEKFLNQLSIRTYWMERVIGGGAMVTHADSSAPPILSKSRRELEKSAKIQRIREYAHQLAWPATAAMGGLGMLLGIVCWLRVRARYIFPEFEVEPRLGGAHAAGVGAVISFASAAVPPASQRDQVPEYLRRS
jgi:hypothetical protein